MLRESFSSISPNVFAHATLAPSTALSSPLRRGKNHAYQRSAAARAGRGCGRGAYHYKAVASSCGAAVDCGGAPVQLYGVDGQAGGGDVALHGKRTGNRANRVIYIQHSICVDERHRGVIRALRKDNTPARAASIRPRRCRLADSSRKSSSRIVRPQPLIAC